MSPQIAATITNNIISVLKIISLISLSSVTGAHAGKTVKILPADRKKISSNIKPKTPRLTVKNDVLILSHFQRQYQNIGPFNWAAQTSMVLTTLGTQTSICQIVSNQTSCKSCTLLHKIFGCRKCF